MGNNRDSFFFGDRRTDADFFEQLTWFIREDDGFFSRVGMQEITYGQDHYAVEGQTRFRVPGISGITIVDLKKERRFWRNGHEPGVRTRTMKNIFREFHTLGLSEHRGGRLLVEQAGNRSTSGCLPGARSLSFHQPCSLNLNRPIFKGDQLDRSGTPGGLLPPPWYPPNRDDSI